jgi:tetratricopeptide (TPR) repeat protein
MPLPHEPRLSLALIVKNEERHLADCLRSVEDVVDEIIMVDTGSADRSIAIGERFGATIINFPWVGDFSAARNISLERATRDWILYLDADERLVEGQNVKLRSLMRNHAVFAYSLIIQGAHALPTGAVYQQNAYPRLFRNHPKIRFEGVVHEQITPSLIRLGKQVLPTEIRIEHLGYGESVEAIKEKCMRNMELLRTQLRKDPTNAYARFQLGNTLAVLQEYDAAQRELEPLVHSDTLAASIRASACNILAEIDIRRGMEPSAIARCLASLALAPSQVMARWFLAAAYIGTEQYRASLDLLSEVLELQSIPLSRVAEQIAHDITIGMGKVRLLMGRCYEGLGDYDLAVRAYIDAAEDPSVISESQNALLRVMDHIHPNHEVLTRIGSSRLASYHFYKTLLDGALKQGSFGHALTYLEALLDHFGDALPKPIRVRFEELKQKLALQLPA